MFATYNAYGVTASDVFKNSNSHFPSRDGSFTLGLSPSEQDEVLAAVQATWFLTLVISQAVHSFTCRTRTRSIFAHGLFSNIYLLIGSSIAVGLGCFIVYTPGLKDIVSAGEIDSLLMLYSALIALGGLWTFTEVRKAWTRAYGPNWLAW